MRIGFGSNMSHRGDRLKTNLLSNENESARQWDDDDDTGGTISATEWLNIAIE